MQSMLWNPIKKVFSEFIQGYDKIALIISFLKQTCSDWIAICIDGSGFDSTQDASLMDIVENIFMKLL